MSRWQLVDGRAPLEEDQDHPRIDLHSESELCQELQRLSQLKPARVGLISTAGDHLDLAIGGPYAGISWWPSKATPGYAGASVAVAATITCPDTIEFIAEGIPDPVSPDELFPVEEVIEATLYFYREHRLPEWISWRQWNTKTKQWDMIPATQPAPAGVLAK